MVLRAATALSCTSRSPLPHRRPRCTRQQNRLPPESSWPLLRRCCVPDALHFLLASADAAGAVAHHRRVPRRHRLQTRHSQPDRPNWSSARRCQLTAAQAAIPSTCAWRAAPTAMASRSGRTATGHLTSFGPIATRPPRLLGATRSTSEQRNADLADIVQFDLTVDASGNATVAWIEQARDGSSGGADERALRLRVPASGHRRSGWPPGARRVWPAMPPAPCSPCTALERAGASSIQWLAPGSRKRRSNRAR